MAHLIEDQERDKNLYLECVCTDPEHVLRFTLASADGKDWPPVLTAYLHLSPFLPWYKRIWEGIKYVLGIRNQDGHFTGWTMDDRDIEKLLELLSEYADSKKKWHQEYPNSYI